MKTISDKLREHALGPCGGKWFGDIEDPIMWKAAVSSLGGMRTSSDLSPDERRMHLLFVAEMLESES